jgi:hypothetical protein
MVPTPACVDTGIVVTHVRKALAKVLPFLLFATNQEAVRSHGGSHGGRFL